MYLFLVKILVNIQGYRTSRRLLCNAVRRIDGDQIIDLSNILEQFFFTICALTLELESTIRRIYFNFYNII